jgi:hypothetical protein
MTQSNRKEPFFITEEIEAELIAAGHLFELLAIACTSRLRDVLARMARTLRHAGISDNKNGP